MLLPDDVTSFARAAARQPESPVQILSPANLAAQCRRFQRELPDVAMYYAFKSSSSRHVVTAIDGIVAGYDVASPQEIADVVSWGVDPARLRYSNPVKAAASIGAARRLGVTKFAAQSVAELEKIAAHAPGASVYLRLQVGASQGALDFSTKFGAPADEVLAAAPRARELGLDLVGITFNVGSQSDDPAVWATGIGQGAAVLRGLQDRGIVVPELNIGGGYPVQYSPSDPDPAVTLRAIRSSLDQVRAEFPGLAVLAEPGRFVSAPSGAILSTVIGREERAGRTWLYLDTGAFHAFMERFEFDRFIYPTYSLRHLLAGGTTSEQPEQPYALTGPTCDAFDTLATSVCLPEGLDVGDRILFMLAGAYTVEYGSHFNGFAPPAVVTLQRPSAGSVAGAAAGAARVPTPRSAPSRMSDW